MSFLPTKRLPFSLKEEADFDNHVSNRRMMAMDTEVMISVQSEDGHQRMTVKSIREI